MKCGKCQTDQTGLYVLEKQMLCCGCYARATGSFFVPRPVKQCPNGHVFEQTLMPARWYECPYCAGKQVQASLLFVDGTEQAVTVEVAQ